LQNKGEFLFKRTLTNLPPKDEEKQQNVPSNLLQGKENKPPVKTSLLEHVKSTVTDAEEREDYEKFLEQLDGFTTIEDVKQLPPETWVELKKKISEQNLIGLMDLLEKLRQPEKIENEKNAVSVNEIDDILLKKFQIYIHWV